MTTFARASALTAGFVAAVAFGIWIGPHVTNRDWSNGWTNTQTAAPAEHAQTPAADTDQKATAAPAHRATVRRVPKTAESTAAKVEAPASAGTILASAPELQQRLKPVLNKGANMAIASQEFRDGEQFALVAHAARNTEVPFMLLKHRVVDEHQTIDQAIRELKPGLDAKAEAERARWQAKFDLAAIPG